MTSHSPASKTLMLGVLILNGLLFQVAWFVIVTNAAGLAFVVTLAVVAVHLALVRYFASLKALWRELFWLPSVVLLGWAAEKLFSTTGVLQHDPANDSVFGVPGWMLLLWLAFATTLRFSLAFLRGKAPIAMFLGASAAFSYWGGAALNPTATLASPVLWSLLLIALVWAFLLPLLVMTHQRYVA